MHSNCAATDLAVLRGSCSHGQYAYIDVSAFLIQCIYGLVELHNFLTLDYVFIPVDVFVSNVKTLPLSEAFC